MAGALQTAYVSTDMYCLFVKPSISEILEKLLEKSCPNLIRFFNVKKMLRVSNILDNTTYVGQPFTMILIARN